MIAVEFAEGDVEALNRDRYQHPDPVVQRRLTALYCKALGYPHHEICQLAGVSSTTLSHLLKLYKAGGIDAVTGVEYRSPSSELDSHRTTLEEHFRNNPPHTVKEACARIEELTGVKRRETQVRQFLHRIGMKPRKTGSIPGKANPEEQADFKKKPRASARRSC